MKVPQGIPLTSLIPSSFYLTCPFKHFISLCPLGLFYRLGSEKLSPGSRIHLLHPVHIHCMPVEPGSWDIAKPSAHSSKTSCAWDPQRSYSTKGSQQDPVAFQIR